MSTRFVIFLSALAIVAVISALAYRAYSRQADLQARALAEAEFQNSEVAKVEAEARQLLGAAAAAATTGVGQPDACDTALRDIARTNSLFAGLTAFDIDGQPICTGPATWLKRIDPRLLELGLTSDGFVIGEQLVADVISKKVLPFVQPFYDASHRVRGVVVTMIELDRLARRLARNWRIEDSIITVADRAGNIVVRLPNSGSWVGRRLPDELVQVLRHPKPGITKVSLGAGDRVEAVGYVPLDPEPRDLFVSVGFQTTSVVGELKRSLRRSVMPVTLVLLAAGLLLVLLPQPRRD